MQKLTVTKERQRVVNFTSPFIKTTFTAVMRREAVYDFATFVYPFDAGLWAAIAASVLLTSAALYLLMRLQRRLLRLDEKEEEEEKLFLTLEETYWFCLKSLLNQGWELLPLTCPARLVAVVWWFFCLIVCSTYTANLAAYLAKPQHLPASVDHLLAQTKIRYGCTSSTTNCDFFRYSSNPLYRHAWYMMTELWGNETIFDRYDEGLDFVRKNDDFALFDDVSVFRCGITHPNS